MAQCPQSLGEREGDVGLAAPGRSGTAPQGGDATMLNRGGFGQGSVELIAFISVCYEVCNSQKLSCHFIG